MNMSTRHLNLTRSLELFAEAERLIPGGSQTNSKRPQAFAFGAYPIFAQRAQGCRIWDVDGNEYIDFVMALGPVTLGYCYPAVDQAIRAQLERGIIYGLLAPLEVEVSRLLVELVPCAEMVRFFKGGGEATAAAARIARACTGRRIILNCGYRGWPDVWTAARNDGGVPEELVGLTVAFPFGDLDSLERIFEQYRDRVAAVFLDVPYASPCPPGYLEAVRDLAHAHGALLVFDEIVAGFRLAPGGAHEYFGVMPDMACLAKGIANGMPLAAVVGRREVMQIAERLLISLTYGGEALSLAAAAAVLDEYRTRPVIAHLWKVGQRLTDGLNAAAGAAGVPFRCGGYAPMAAMWFDVPAEQVDAAWRFFLAGCAARGVLFRRGGLNLVSYSHSEHDIDRAIEVAGEVFHEMHARGLCAESRPPGRERADRGQQAGPWNAH
jgi:glutamate-1-semialdehyde aminotransferase